MRGLSVALFEKGDLAGGTSSATSKMVHGGIRYLEQLDFSLVREALRERAVLLRIAPHLVRPQAFVVPVYEGSRRGPRWIRLGLWLYDCLALGRRLGKARFLTPAEVLARIPGLASHGLLGGGLYFDAVMDDSRLCLANAVAAREEAEKRSVPFYLRTYTEVLSIQPSSPIRLEVRDRVVETTQSVLAHRVVRALGPWSPRDQLVPSKGVHLVLPAAAAQDGLVFQHSRDGRVFFVVPWKGFCVVGTTETPFNGAPDRIEVEPDDVEYLLAEAQRRLPGMRWTRHDLAGVFAGVRPLAPARGLARRFRSGDAGRVSRRHRLTREDGEVYTLVGGKYTTYRAVACEVLDEVAGFQRTQSHTVPLPGAEEGDWDAHRRRLSPEEIARHGEEELRRLYRRYGCRWRAVLRLAEDPRLAAPLVPGCPDLRAEVVHGIREELVTYPEDFLCRRSALRFLPVDRRAAYRAVESLIREHVRPLPPDLDAAREEFEARLRHEETLTGKARESQESPAAAAS